MSVKHDEIIASLPAERRQRVEARASKLIAQERLSTLIKADIVEALYEQSGKSRQDVKQHVDNLITLMAKAIDKDHKLLLSGFGSFECYAKHPRRGRNPQTSEAITLDARNVIVFRLSKKFRAELNVEAE